MAKKRKTDNSDQQHFEGMEPPRIASLTKAVRIAHDRGTSRAEAQESENEARDRVIHLMQDHADDLRNDRGQLVYKVDGLTACITPGKDKLKVSVKKDVEDEEAAAQAGAEDGVDIGTSD